MNTIIRILTLLILSWAATGLYASTEQESATSEWELRSEWWPAFVRLAKPLELPEHERTLKVGRRGVLIRVEDDFVIVDYGRYGLHRLPLEDTDFKLQFAELSRERNWESHGLFTKTYGTRFYHPKSWSQLKQKDIIDDKYFLLAYAELQTEEGREGIQQFDQKLLQDWTPKGLHACFIPVNAPEQPQLVDLLTELDVTTPTMPTFLAKGHVSALGHEPENFTVVLLDKNGRLLARYDLKDARDVSAWRADIEMRLANDRTSLSDAKG